MSDSEALAERVRQTVQGMGGRLVPTLISGSDRILTAFLKQDIFIDLLQFTGARLVYLSEDDFEAEAMATKQVIESDDDGRISFERADALDDAADTPEFKRFVKRWQARDGAVCSVTATFMYEGVNHVTMQDEAWLSEFETEAEKLTETLLHRYEERQSGEKAREHQEIVSKSRVLAEHAQFNAPRPTIAKRTALAKILFPDTEDFLIKQIVTEAAMFVWLQQGGITKA
jgi:hypothetical protein